MTMNNGDPNWGASAAAAGLTVMDGSENRKYGFRWINQLMDLIVTRVFGIAQGGTGASTAAAARTNLGFTAAGGALPIALGGTGATTAAGALAALGEPNIQAGSWSGEAVADSGLYRVNLTFPKAFADAPSSVLAIGINGDVALSASTPPLAGILETASTTSCQLYFAGKVSAVNWIAVG